MSEVKAVITATLKGPDSLVWPLEKGLAPEWMSNYGQFTGDLSVADAQAVWQAWRDQTPIRQPDGRDWYVVEVTISNEGE